MRFALPIFTFLSRTPPGAIKKADLPGREGQKGGQIGVQKLQVAVFHKHLQQEKGRRNGGTEGRSDVKTERRERGPGVVNGIVMNGGNGHEGMRAACRGSWARRSQVRLRHFLSLLGRGSSAGRGGVAGKLRREGPVPAGTELHAVGPKPPAQFSNVQRPDFVQS